MLADQDHPLEDAIAEGDTGAQPDPRVLVVYRTRGVPWLLVPPLLLLAAVAAIVLYRRSEDPERAAVAWREASTHPSQAKTASGTSSAPDASSSIDALSELSAATGRPVAASASAADGPRFDPTPPPVESDPPPVTSPPEPKQVGTPAPAPSPPQPEANAEPKPAPTEPKVESKLAPTEPKAEPKPPEPKPAPTEPNPATPTEVTPAPGPDRVTSNPPAVPPAASPANASSGSPFDPLVTPAAGDAPPADLPAPVEPPARRDPVGFDPNVMPEKLDDAPRPAVAPLPGDEKHPAPAPTQVAPPAPEQPFELDRRAPAGADARRAERTREIEEDIQAEAERRLADKARLAAIKADEVSPDPIELMRNREKFKQVTRRLAAQQRPEFHEELKRVIREQGRNAGPDIKATRDRFGWDTLPEIMLPAARDLSRVASRLTTPEKIRRMRQWGLPETMILDDLYERQLLNVNTRGGPNNEDEAWFYAAWVLLHYPPGTSKANAQPAAPAQPAPGR